MCRSVVALLLCTASATHGPTYCRLDYLDLSPLSLYRLPVQLLACWTCHRVAGRIVLKLTPVKQWTITGVMDSAIGCHDAVPSTVAARTVEESPCLVT
jgi:hypothetical protein